MTYGRLFATLAIDDIHNFVVTGALTLRYDGRIFDSIWQAYPAPMPTKATWSLFPAREPGRAAATVRGLATPASSLIVLQAAEAR
jgi:hypothetical protein